MDSKEKKCFNIQGFISEVFWTYDNYAFQRVGNVWNLYARNGYFLKTFRSFQTMCEFIKYMRDEDAKKENGIV